MLLQARHHCQQVRSAFLLFLMCQMSLTLVQAAGAILLLPPVLSPHLLLWLTGVVVPLLSLTLICNPIDLQVAKMAQGKKTEALSKQVGNMVEC